MKPMTRMTAAMSNAALALFATLVAMTVAAAPAREAAGANIAPKPVAPIAITHEFGSDPVVGLPLDLTLSIAAESDLSGISVTLTADDPLAMIEPVGSVGLGSLSAGEAADLAVTVLPLVHQTHHLGVTVTATVDGVIQTRSVSVSIRMPGSGEHKADDLPASQKAEEHLRSFEAIETIR
jgi:hypothetical protein